MHLLAHRFTFRVASSSDLNAPACPRSLGVSFRLLVRGHFDMLVHSFPPHKPQPTARNQHSKFDTLGHAYTTSFQEVSGYLENCGSFAQKLLRGLESYLQFPEKRICCKDSAGNDRPLHDSLYLENGFWHMNLEIALDRPRRRISRTSQSFQSDYPPQSVMLPLLFKPISPSQFVVNLEGSKERFIINAHQEDDFISFYEMVFHRIQAHYRQRVAYIAQRQEAPNWIVIEEPFSMMSALSPSQLPQPQH